MVSFWLCGEGGREGTCETFTQVGGRCAGLGPVYECQAQSYLQEAERLVLQKGAVVLDTVQQNLEDARRRLVSIVLGEAKGVAQRFGLALLLE